MGILCVDVDKINLENADFMKRILKLIIFISDIWLGVINLKNVKYIKKI